LGRSDFSRFLNPAAVLVPVPRSSMQLPGALWIPDQLSSALVEVGLGGRVARLLRRTAPIPKAAWSASSERDALRNYQTLAVQQDLLPTPEILLVDDVVVTGSALLGSANRLREAYASIPIRGFAAVRTMTNPSDFTDFNSPVTGTITLKPNGLCQRVP
jgi:predicted amidophosphoribosyltransferase